MFAAGLVWGVTVALGLAWAVPVVALTNAPALGDRLVIRSWGTGAGLPQNTVNSIVQTPDGYLWVGTRDGLARFDGVRFTVYGLPDGLQSVEIQTLFVDRQGTLWIGTSGGGLSRWVEDRIENVTLPRQLVADDIVTALAEDADGRLWIGTLAGLSVWQDGRFIDLPELASVERFGIRALRSDRGGGMWIATLSHGLYEYRERRLTEIRGPPDNETILAYCLLEDQAGGFWASVGNGTVLCRRGGEWSKIYRDQWPALCIYNLSGAGARWHPLGRIFGRWPLLLPGRTVHPP